MADTPTVDSIQIEIEASSEKAVSKINGLVSSLQQLKSVSSGFTSSLKNVVTGINSLEKIKEIKNAETVAKQLEALKRAANGFSNNVGDNLVLLAAGLKELSGLSISKSAAENMTKLSEALRNIHEKDAKRLSAVAQSMTAISQVPSMTKAINQLDKLPEVLERLQGADISGVAGKMRELADAMEPLADRMKDIYAGFASLPQNIQDFVKSYAPPHTSETETVESDTAIEGKISLLKRLVDTFREAFSHTKEIFDTNNKLSELEIKLKTATNTYNELLKAASENVSPGISDYKRLTDARLEIQKTSDEIKKLKEKLSELDGKSKGFGKIKDAAKAVGNGLKSLVGSALNGLKGIGKTVAGSVAKPFKNAVKAVTKWKDAIGRIAFYRVVRGAIKMIEDGFRDGTANLYQYSRMVGTEFAPAMDKLATSALYLKNSVGAIAAPLIQAVAPAVDFLVDKFVELLNVIGKTFAALTGKSVYTQAKKHAVEYADAAKDAANATKNFTLGIDELNVIQENANKSGGNLDDYTSMFEEVKVPIEQLDWAAEIRKAIEEGKWKDVGAALGKKLNEVVKSFDSVKWGKTLGASINNGLNAAYGFLSTFDFHAFGRKIAGFVNCAVEETDWSLLGATLVAKVNAGLNTLIGFLGGIEWGGIGKAIGNGLRGMLNESSQWIHSKDWRRMGSDFYSNIKKTIEGIDFDSLAEDFFYWLGSSLAAGVLFIESFVSDVVDDISGHFSKYIEEAKDKFGDNGIAIVAGILDGIIDGISGILDWLDEHVFSPFIEAFQELFDINSPSVVMEKQGKYIMQGLYNGIESEMPGIIGLLSGITEFLNGVFTLDWKKAWNGIKQIFKTAWNGIVGMLEGAVNLIISGINKLIDTLNSVKIEIPATMFTPAFSIGFNLNRLAQIAIPRLASGGFPETGQMFIARERGPELVGNIGNKTAVVNNEQIISGISQGVENANGEQNALLREQNELLRAILQKDTSVRIGNREIKRAYDTATRQSGVPIMAGGVLA